MQTFLPYPDFIQSAHVLDWRRLGKQRVEAYQLLIALGDKWALQRRGIERPSSAWQNHPAAALWRGCESALRLYMNTCILEWQKRGYRNTMLLAPVDETQLVIPSWLGNSAFHLAHQSNLIRKDADYYRPIFGYDVPDNLEYIWKD